MKQFQKQFLECSLFSGYKPRRSKRHGPLAADTCQLGHYTAADELVQLVPGLWVIFVRVKQVGEMCITYLVRRQLQLQAAGVDNTDDQCRYDYTRSKIWLTI